MTASDHWMTHEIDVEGETTYVVQANLAYPSGQICHVMLPTAEKIIQDLKVDVDEQFAGFGFFTEEDRLAFLLAYSGLR